MSRGLDRPERVRDDPARAILVGVDFGRGKAFDATLDELALLAESAGDVAVARVVARRKAPDPALFVGSGKADEIKALVQGHQAEAVLFDQALSPAQQRNLEQHLGVAVADRTMLILEIFGERAQSHEGKLQVELARLQYLSTRLVRRWSHLERQRGGIGTRGGPGEAQIELDRRMIGERIKSREEAARARQEAARHAAPRARAQPDLPHLAGRATPTPASRRCSTRSSTRRPMRPTSCSPRSTRRPASSTWRLEPAARSVSLSDTVGFIRDLPHKLIEAFEATLQEAADADLLLHVVDCASPVLAEQMAEVQRVLTEIGAGRHPAGAGVQQARPARGHPAAARVARPARGRCGPARAARLRQRAHRRGHAGTAPDSCRRPSTARWKAS